MVQCKIVIPLYQEDITHNEYLSLKNNLSILKNYPISLLIPENLIIDKIIEELSLTSDRYEIIRISEEFLGYRNGIAGYNKLMLSLNFYNLFADCEYILICQTDAWIFRDELRLWCEKGYDYIGGIWWRRGIWSYPIVRHFTPKNRRLYGKVGNGGLSLRKISSFRKACIDYQKRIDSYIKKTHHMYSEDVFWAIEPKSFKYPAMLEATMFAFDNHPDRCLNLTNGKLPFGCHGWLKPRRLEFWKSYILKS